MGCDIHSYAEVRVDGKWSWVRDFANGLNESFESGEVWPDRNYGLFGFLADVRNYSAMAPLAQPKGLPDDMSAELREGEYGDDSGYHSASWFTLAELQAHDYDQTVWDRRVTRRVSENGRHGGCTTDDPEEGERLPLREFLGTHFFERIELLAALGAPEDVRVVFWFDN